MVRLHAGCDLLAPNGIPVYAMADGIVTMQHIRFREGTYHIEIKHQDGLVAYRELGPTKVPGLNQGEQVKQGQLIGYLAPNTNNGGIMLHLEIYKSTLTGSTVIKDHPPSSRRDDLIDPTPILDRLLNRVK